MLQRELRDSLRTLIAGLPPDRRDVVLLVMRGHSFSEIATIRDATLQKAGLRVLRVTGKRLEQDWPGVLADILALRRP